MKFRIFTCSIATHDFAESFAEEARTLFIRTCARLLTVEPPEPRPGEEDRRQAREQLPRP